MNMKASNEVRVKDEPIYDNQPKNIINTKESIKNEKQLPKIDSKRKREDISRDDQPNKRKRQSIVSNKVKEEPIDIEMQTLYPEFFSSFILREIVGFRTNISRSVYIVY